MYTTLGIKHVDNKSHIHHIPFRTYGLHSTYRLHFPILNH
jgi:hypothetical protein